MTREQAFALLQQSMLNWDETMKDAREPSTERERFEVLIAVLRRGLDRADRAMKEQTEFYSTAPMILAGIIQCQVVATVLLEQIPASDELLDKLMVKFVRPMQSETNGKDNGAG